MKQFTEGDLSRLYKPKAESGKGDNGQVTIIGGSALFHGAPLLTLKTASRIVDMVFFASPTSSLEDVCDKLKSQLSSFIWIPFDEVDQYIEKSEAVLIGPGLLRYHKESEECRREKICDETGAQTKKTTENLLKKFSAKQWVIDAGSLQTMDPEMIPKNAILTPNRKEFELLFNLPMNKDNLEKTAQKYCCIIVGKNAETLVVSPEESVLVKGGNAGLTKGGTGDVLAGLTVALAATNEPLLAACAASFIAKKAADELYKKVGFAYNADDLAQEIPKILGKYFRK